MFCPKCGAEVDDNAVFCPKCGNQNKRTTIEVARAHVTDIKDGYLFIQGK